MAKKKKDYSRQILERIVGTKRKTEIADKLKEAFAEKYGIKLFLGGPYFKNINKEVLKKYNTFKKYSEVLAINKHLQ